MKVNQYNNINVGTISYLATKVVPNGWLECNGDFVSKTQYDKLFKIIGIYFGENNDKTKFKIPDLRGQFLRGWSNGSKNDINREFGSYQNSENKSHNHTATMREAGGHSHTTRLKAHNTTGGWTGGQQIYTTNVGSRKTTPNSSWQPNHTHTITIKEQGSESRPINVALLICIKY